MKISVLIGMLACWLYFSACSHEPPVEAPEQDSSMTLSVTFQESESYTGWLYSYGMEWVPCVQESATWWPSFIRSAHASHPVTYTEIGEWAWHQRILIGQEQELIFQGPLGNTRYCGLHWLFAHGGITADGVLSSFQVEQGDDVLATSHHAWALNIEFSEPLCARDPGQIVEIEIPTQTWLDQTMIETSTTLNTREGTVRLPDFLTVRSPPCP